MNSNIFCNSPWYEMQIYWDGSLGFCCQASHKAYDDEHSSKFNLKTMTIKEWFNSEPMKLSRLSMFGNQKNSICKTCYVYEDHGSTSRRHRANQKSVIFTKSAFEESYLQSPHYKHFEYSRNNFGLTNTMPIDLHIDLGNHCNLACKMCHKKASSTIAVQMLKWGDKDAKKYIGTDWTRDQKVWDRTLEEISSIPNLKNIHFMGGETLLTKRFEDFIDFMVDKNRFDINFSFVTNGTSFNESLMNKLKLFKRVGIEISIETMDDRNSYVRQGTIQQDVITNIEKYKKFTNGTSITVCIRPAPSLLTVGTYHHLLRYCFQNKFVVKSLFVIEPDYLDIRILPESIKNNYLINYKNLLEELDLLDENIYGDFNESDPNENGKIIKSEINHVINVLESTQPLNSEERLKNLVLWCKRWDEKYKLNAGEIYPELKDIFIKYGYYA